MIKSFLVLTRLFPAPSRIGILLLLGSVPCALQAAVPLGLLRPAEGAGFQAMRDHEDAASDVSNLRSELSLGVFSYQGPKALPVDSAPRVNLTIPENVEEPAHIVEPAEMEEPVKEEGAEPLKEPVRAEDSAEFGYQESADPHTGSKDATISESDAELAIRVGDFETAAEIYARIVSQTHDENRSKAALLSLAEVYREMDDPMRVVSILERFRREYPTDKRLPEVLLRLGFLYREMGVPQQAVDAFFGVLKQSFNMSEDDLAMYREITHEASYQIAETYYRMHQYALASEFFARLLRAARPNTPERLELLAKCAYSNYFSGDFRKVLYLLELKDWSNIDSSRQAEFRFLRASAYWSLRDTEGARAEVINLADLEVEPNKDPYWNFWWKYVGNELANDLFAQEDYVMAHKLYYSLLHLSGEEKWQLPVIFQIGRCREHLGNIDEAREIYGQILKQIGEIAVSDRSGNLIVLETRVQDQLKNLDWEHELGRAKELYSPPAVEGNDRPDSLASIDARSR